MIEQHVIYSYDPDHEPHWAYRSFPVAACYGLADDLDGARAAYRQSYGLATEDLSDAPTSVEHLEQRHSAGYWTRVRLGHDEAERNWVVGAVLTALAEYPEDVPEIDRSTLTGIGEPVVIAALPDDTVASIVGQLQEGEAACMALAFADTGSRRELVWFGGMAQRGARPAVAPPLSLAQKGLTFGSTLEECMQADGFSREELHRAVAPPPITSVLVA